MTRAEKGFWFGSLWIFILAPIHFLTQTHFLVTIILGVSLGFTCLLFATKGEHND